MNHHQPGVLIIISSFFPVVGGAQKQALLLAKTLKKRSINVTIMTRPVPGAPQKESIDGVEILRVGNHQGGPVWSVLSIISWLVTAWRMRLSFDIIYAIQPQSSAFAAGIAGVITRKSVICKIPSSHNIGIFRTWRAAILKRIIHRFVVTNSQDFSEMVALTSSEQVVVIPNGITMNPKTNSNWIPQRDLNILFLGRLVPKKAPDSLMKAFANVKYGLQGARLTYVGGGSERKLLEQMARKMGLSKAVSFEGEVDPREVGECYDRASVFVQCSLDEGLSNAMLEAMVRRVPVVASRIPGNVDLVIDEETGLLFDPEDHDQLSAQILRTLTEAEATRERTERAYGFVMNNFDIEITTGRFLQLYEELEGRPI